LTRNEIIIWIFYSWSQPRQGKKRLFSFDNLWTVDFGTMSLIHVCLIGMLKVALWCMSLIGLVGILSLCILISCIVVVYCECLFVECEKRICVQKMIAKYCKIIRSLLEFVVDLLNEFMYIPIGASMWIYTCYPNLNEECIYLIISSKCWSNCI